MTQDHTLKSFDQDLDELRQLLGDLATWVTDELEQAILALISGNGAAAAEVIERDATADALQLQIQKAAVNILVRHQPVAIDLREVVATERMAGDLERVGDHAKNIAKRTIALGAPVPEAHAASVERFGRDVERMLHKVLDALSKRDAVAAHRAWSDDEPLDEAHADLFMVLLNAMQDGRTSVLVGTHLLFVAKSLERIGDHATNVAEDIRFMVTGQITPPR
ncbi:MAG: phosphate signaling complex protein PhoU [Pseudomonadota bacterium]